MISSVGHNKQSEDVVLDPGNLLFSVHTQHDYNARASVHSCIVPSIKHEVDKNRLALMEYGLLMTFLLQLVQYF